MTIPKRSILTGMKIFIEGRFVEQHALIVEGSYIRAIVAETDMLTYLPADVYECSSDDYLLPGFIDLHIHGAAGCDVMDGTADSLRKIAASLAQEGVTRFLATTMTSSVSHIESVLSTIPLVMSEQAGAALIGVHLEGPFIAPTQHGAQPLRHCRLPDIELFKRWQKITGNAIKLVTVAPELVNALPFISFLKKEGIIASIGHTHASYEETELAIAAGCAHATHLFNAMTPCHHRRPGAALAILLNHQIMAELIVDGIHLHPATVDLALRLKGEDGLILVSDAMRAKCLGDGRYELGGQSVTVTAGCARLADGTLAGSTLRLPEAVNNMQQHAACTLAQAIKMVTLNPARALGIEAQTGSIAEGKLADLVVMNAKWEVKQVFRAGMEIFSQC